jgi:hypothetical protein
MSAASGTPSSISSDPFDCPYPALFHIELGDQHAAEKKNNG